MGKKINLTLLAFFIFLIDRLSKVFVINKATNLDQSNLYYSKFINIHLVWNDGIAFGLLSMNNSVYYSIITIIILFIILILLFFTIKAKTNFEKLGFTFIIGGAIGNFYDRVFYQAVPDFIDLHINNFHWFIFNIADIFVTIGVLWLILVEFTINKKKNGIN